MPYRKILNDKALSFKTDQQGGAMLKTFAKIAISAIIAAGLFGCAQQNWVAKESLLKKNWGRAFETARYNQILNPNAGKNLKPVEGLDGRAAERNISDYLKGKAPQKKASAEFGVSVFNK